MLVVLRRSGNAARPPQASFGWHERERERERAETEATEPTAATNAYKYRYLELMTHSAVDDAGRDEHE